MKTAIKEVKGNWDLGYTLDKHIIKSTYLGVDEYGHRRFDNVRTEVGEATYQLKNHLKSSEAEPLAKAVFDNIFSLFEDVHAIIPMAASTSRHVQPVDQVAEALAKLTKLRCYKGWLVKATDGRKLKDIAEEDRPVAVKGTIRLNGDIDEKEKVNILLLDDLYQSGASANEACLVLQTYAKIGKIYFAALTRKY